jgi:hypothetical protein
MKNLFFVVALLLSTVSAEAQSFTFGFRGGVHTQVDRPKDILILADTAFNFGVENFKFGTQFGMFVRFGDKWSIQPELVFNSNRTDYRSTDQNLVQTVRTEKYQNLDIPLMFGIKLGPVRANAGPVAHYFLNSNSELFDFEGYDEKFDQLTWGYQAGFNIALGRFSADIRYEGNFHKAGDQITFFGQEYNFSNNPTRLIIALNVALIK